MRTTIIGIGLVLLAAVGCDRKPPPPGPGTPPSPQAVPRVKDGQSRCPVCNMAVAVNDQTPTHDYRGVRYYVCTMAGHADQFRANPSAHATGQPGEKCVCFSGGMTNCRCGHCAGRSELCECWSRGIGGEHGDDHGHDH